MYFAEENRVWMAYTGKDLEADHPRLFKRGNLVCMLVEDDSLGAGTAYFSQAPRDKGSFASTIYRPISR